MWCFRYQKGGRNDPTTFLPSTTEVERPESSMGVRQLYSTKKKKLQDANSNRSSQMKREFSLSKSTFPDCSCLHFDVQYSPRLASFWVQIRIWIESMVFLHHSQISSHLIPLLLCEGGKFGSFLGPILGRPFGKFPGLAVMFRGGQVGFVGLLNHNVAAISKISHLKRTPYSQNNA
jgi:hypothetical protein